MSDHTKSQIVFYLGWVGMIFAETTLWSLTGLFFGVIVFFGGGVAWATWHIHKTSTDMSIHGPVLRLMDRILKANDKLWLLPAAFLGGGPGVGLVLKKQGSNKVWLYSIIASAFYALLWCAIHRLRPEVGVPIEFWPSTHFLENLWHALQNLWDHI